MIFKLIFFVLFCTSGLIGQTNSKNYVLSFKISPIYGYHRNSPTNFPLGYTDASITPLTQNYRMGYDISVTGNKKINKNIHLGITTYISHFGFSEYGEELSFWTNETKEYMINREFTVLGFGVESSYFIVNNELNNLCLSLGSAYELFISNKGVYLWKEAENNTKYTLNSSLNYSHKLTTKMNILVGLFTRIGLRNYFDNIDYKPSRYGLNIGFDYHFN